MINKIVFFSFIALLSISSCKKNNDIVHEYNCNDLAQSGLTVKIDGDIEADFSLGSIQEYLAYSNCISNCSDTDLDCTMNCTSLLSSFPTGGVFSVICHISNATDERVSFTLNAGDMFSPDSSSDQPMLNPSEVTIVVEGNKSVSKSIAVYCLASNKSAPSSDSKYTFCNTINSNGCLNEIVDILKTKDLSKISFTQATEVQSIIWNCTDNSTADLAYLNNLPNL